MPHIDTKSVVERLTSVLTAAGAVPTIVQEVGKVQVIAQRGDVTEKKRLSLPDALVFCDGVEFATALAKGAEATTRRAGEPTGRSRSE